MQHPISQNDVNVFSSVKENQFFDRKSARIKPNDASVQLTLENSATSRVLRQFDTLEASVGQDVMEGLNGYEIAAVQLAMGRGRVTTKELGERIGKGSSLCARTLKGLAAMGIFEWHGSSTHDPSQYYTLTK